MAFEQEPFVLGGFSELGVLMSTPGSQKDILLGQFVLVQKSSENWSGHPLSRNLVCR